MNKRLFLTIHKEIMVKIINLTRKEPKNNWKINIENKGV